MIAGGAGTITSADVTSVVISCSANLARLLADDFDRPDQQGLGVTPDGQAWLITGPGYLNVAIKDGRYVGGPPELDNNVSYAGLLTIQQAVRFGGRYSFVPSGTGGSHAPLVALISSNDTAFTLKRMVHLIASRNGVVLTWWEENDQNNLPAECVGSRDFSAPLSNDGTAFPLYMTIRGSTVTVDKPDGTQLICSDPHFSLLAGTLSIWELAYGSADSDVPRWDEVQAFFEASAR
jgi:hypothetical protein